MSLCSLTASSFALRSVSATLLLGMALAAQSAPPAAPRQAPAPSTTPASTTTSAGKATQTSRSAAARFAAYGHRGSFLLQRAGQPPQVVHGADLADTPLRPASTFKVMLALIALETGALPGADAVVRWDGTPYPEHREWEKDMALGEAMRTSSEAYFRTLAKRIGRERLATWVQRVGYGNGRVGDKAELAWHDGVLTVTTRQQLAFIDRLRRGDLPFKPSTIAATKAAMLDSTFGDATAGNIRIYGKTGTHLGDDNTGNAWWIGWVDGPGGGASFALGVDLKRPDDRARRIALGRQLLRDAGVLPAAER